MKGEKKKNQHFFDFLCSLEAHVHDPYRDQKLEVLILLLKKGDRVKGVKNIYLYNCQIMSVHL